MASKLNIIPLGGLTEVGKNMTVIEYGKDLIVIDCGSMFPTDEMLGIDLVIPDMAYLEKNAARIRAFLITHGHEDHIGALPYALKKFNVPVYGTKLTLALISYKLEENGVKDAQLNCIAAGDVIRLGCFQIEFIHTNHSVAGSVAMAIGTPMGTVIHTGDFKVDYTPVDGESIDLGRLSHYGKKGVLCLLSDSTNAERPGYTMSEKMVGVTFERYFDSAAGRVIVATFASNIHRIQQVIDAAIKHGRKICFQGRSMVRIAELATEIGYLNVPEDLIVDVEKLKNYDHSEICVLTTGSQGEPMSGLSRMANSSHRLNIGKGDTVIVSSTPIPGNELSVSKVINQLFKKGVNVVYEGMADVHVSGHARQEELKLMLSVVKPKYFIPVHGEFRHLKHHAMIAEKIGVLPDNIFLCDTGTIVEFTKDSAKISGVAPGGSVMIDGSGIGDIGNIVLRDRRILSQDGLVVVVVTLDKKNGKLLAGPDVLSRGFVYVRESEELLDDAKDVVRAAVAEFENRPYSDWAAIKNSLKNVLRDYLYDKTKRNPMILPIVVEV